eukprot:scaffold86991_cov70-Phaeocystis_antarctica.AAC.3
MTVLNLPPWHSLASPGCFSPQTSVPTLECWWSSICLVVQPLMPTCSTLTPSAVARCGAHGSYSWVYGETTV